MTNAPRPSDDDPSQRSAASRIANLENRARQTGNPVYVWMAIWEAHAAGLLMPDWCYDQVVSWAYRVHTLAHGLDPDLEFKPSEGESRAKFAERLHSRYERPELDCESALKAAHAIFGNRRGWNPFREVRADQAKIKEHVLNEATKLAPKEFVAGLREKRPTREERDSRRRVAAGKALSREKPQPTFLPEKKGD